MEKLNNSSINFEGVYSKQSQNIPPAYNSKKINTQLKTDIKFSNNFLIKESVPILNNYVVPKIPKIEMKKLKIPNNDCSNLNDKNNKVFKKISEYDNDNDIKKPIADSIKGNLDFSINRNLKSTLKYHDSINSKNLEKSSIAFTTFRTKNLPMHVISITIISKNNKAQIYISDFNCFIVGAKRHSINSTTGSLNNSINNSLEVGYSKYSSSNKEKRDQCINNHYKEYDSISKKLLSENEEKIDIKENSILFNNIYTEKSSYLPNTFQNFYNNNFKTCNYSHLLEKEIQDENITLNLTENNIENINLGKFNNSVNQINKYKDCLNLDSSKEMEFLIEKKSHNNEISEFDLIDQNNLINAKSNLLNMNNYYENRISNSNIIYNRNIQLLNNHHLNYKNNIIFSNTKNIINIEKYIRFEDFKKNRVLKNKNIIELNEKLIEFSNFNKNINISFCNQSIEQDFNFKYKLFSDQYFPATFESFFAFNFEFLNPISKNDSKNNTEESIKRMKLQVINSGKFNDIIFKRPSEIYENYNYNLFSEKLENILYNHKDYYINSSFNSVLNILIDKFPFLIYRIFRTNIINYSGYYEVILFISNRWQVIYIDDYFPYDIKLKKFYGENKTTNDIWEFILEKSIAKAHGGYLNYMLLDAHELFNIITGFNSIIIENKNFDLFSYIKDSLKNNFCLSVKYVNSAYNNDVEVGNNFYLAIIDAFEIIDENDDKNNIKLIKLRKPFYNFNCNFEIKKLDFIPKFSESILLEIKKKFYFDTFGYVIVFYSDFKKYFESLYCSMTFVNKNKSEKSITKNHFSSNIDLQDKNFKNSEINKMNEFENFFYNIDIKEKRDK